VVERYDKIRLLPFDEYVPLRRIVPWPSWLVGKRIDFEPGERLTVFRAGEHHFGVQICWENLFPDQFRRLAARGVDFMVALTNEAFTDFPPAHEQMLAMNVFRAIENRVAIARAAPTGITTLIDPRGRIREVVTGPGGERVHVPGTLVGEIPLSRERSLYTRHGDRFMQVVGVGLAALLAWAAAREHDPGAEVVAGVRSWK